MGTKDMTIVPTFEEFKPVGQQQLKQLLKDEQRNGTGHSRKNKHDISEWFKHKLHEQGPQMRPGTEGRPDCEGNSLMCGELTHCRWRME